MVWLEPADVAEAFDLGDVGGNTALASATAAAAAFVERKRPDLITEDNEYQPTADVKHGAAMLAQRLYERRANMLGVAPSAGFDEAAAILRYDPDIEQLLRIGRHAPFGFGSAAPVVVVEEEVVP